MAVRTVEELKNLFAVGKYPTAADYADLIDSLAGGSGIETFTSDSGMFSSDKQVGAIEIKVNKNSYDETINVPTINGDVTFTIPMYGAVAFIKIEDSSYNYWTPVALPIQQGGSNGDSQGS